MKLSSTKPASERAFDLSDQQPLGLVVRPSGDPEDESVQLSVDVDQAIYWLVVVKHRALPDKWKGTHQAVEVPQRLRGEFHVELGKRFVSGT